MTDDFEPRRMKRLDERESPVDILTRGVLIEPPIIIEDLDFPSGEIPPRLLARVKVDIRGALGQGESVYFHDVSQDPPMLFMQTIIASAYVIVLVDETYYVVSFSRVPKLPTIERASDLFLNLGFPPVKTETEGVFVIRQANAYHLAFKHKPIIRETKHSKEYKKLYDWLKDYIPIGE